MSRADIHRVYIVALLTIGALARLVAWGTLGVDIHTEVAMAPVYHTALGEHLAEFIVYTHTKPVGNYLRDFLSLSLFGPDNVNYGNLLFTSIADLLASTLVFGLLVRLQVGQLLASAISALWSIGLIAWEYWYGGGHYDHFNVFLFALLAWITYVRMQNNNRYIDLMAGGVGGLLILFHSAAPILVFLLLLTTLNSKLVAKRLLASLILPICALAPSAGKNWIQFDLFSTSSTAGQNMIQFVYWSMGDIRKVGEFAREEGLPEWWIWCFEEGVRRQPDQPFVGGAYGLCFMDAEGHYDFAALERKLVHLSERELLAKVQLDKKASDRTPWLLTGAVSESTSRFALEFGRQSRRVWLAFLVDRPLDFVFQLSRSVLRFFWDGSLFIATDLYAFWPRPTWVRWVGVILAPIFILGNLVAVAIVILTGYKFTKGARSFVDSRTHFIVTLCLVFTVGTLAMCALHCCENSRMYMSFTPWSLVLGTVALRFLIRGDFLGLHLATDDGRAQNI